MRLIKILALSVLLVCLTQAPAMADTESRQEITLQQAVDRALEMSKTLKKSELQKDVAKEQREDAQKEVSYTPTGMVNDDIQTAYASLLQAELNYQMSSKDIKSLERDITAEVVEKCVAVKSAQVNIQATETNLENARYKNTLAQKKLQLGLIAQYELEDAQSDLEKTEADLRDSQTKLVQAFGKFNSIAGYSLDYRPLLVSNIEYGELEISSVDIEVNRAIAASTDVWKALQNITLEKQDLWMSKKSYDLEKIDIKIAELEAAEAEDTLEKSIRDMLNSIDTMRNHISTAQTSVKEAGKNLERIEKKYAVGIGILSDVVQAEVDLAIQENNLAGLGLDLAGLMASYNKLTGRDILPETL